MKRIVALALAFVLLTAALASCGTREKVDLSKMTSLAEINGSGAIIAAQSGTFHLTALQEQMTGVEKKEYKDFTTLLTALTSGAIDGYIAEEPTAVDACAQNSSLGYIKLKNNDTGFTVTGDDNGIAIGLEKGSELTAQINAILAEKIPSSVQTALMEQIFTICVNPESEQNLTLALQSANTDTSNGTLRVSMECAYNPFNWTQTNDANGAVRYGENLYANGYDVQIAKFIAAELGMKLEIVQYEFDSMVNAVKSGNVDAIIAGMSPTAERLQEIDFTTCYYKSELVIIYKKS
jgi:ABC-type amino acid transport substrate-binding protein